MEIGMLGALFILSAWIYETYRALERGDKLNAKFICIYLTGNILLTYYAITIHDNVFMILNGAIAIMSLIELELAIRKTKRKPSRNR